LKASKRSLNEFTTPVASRQAHIHGMGVGGGTKNNKADEGEK
jgi:hypothetical protein